MVKIFKKKQIQILAIFIILLILGIPLSSAQTIDKGSMNFKYDENGNLIRGVDEYYVYNSLNQLTEIKEKNANGRTLAKYFYDETGQRIKKISYDEQENSKTTYYIDKNYVKEKDSNGETDTTYYYGPLGLAAEKDQDENYKYYHPNHLGSTHITTDENAEVIEETAYKPFGLSLEGGKSRYTYTGQEDDKESSLMYYNARYYSPLLRHFTQPDTILPNVYDPQQLNKYGYVSNNPVKNTDPSGNYACAGPCEVATGTYLLYLGLAYLGGLLLSTTNSNDYKDYYMPTNYPYQYPNVEIEFPVAPGTELPTYFPPPNPTLEGTINFPGAPGFDTPYSFPPAYDTDLPLLFPTPNLNEEMELQVKNPLGRRFEDGTESYWSEPYLPYYIEPTGEEVALTRVNELGRITQVRWYDEFGRATKDLDLTDHGRGDHKPGHTHKIDPVDPKNPKAGIKRFPPNVD